MIGWGIFLGVLLLIGFTRVRIRLSYDEHGLFAWLRIGFFRMKLYPRPLRKEKPKKEKTPEKKEKTEQKPKKEKKSAFGIKIDGSAVKDIIALARKTLRRSLRLFRFELIEVRFTSGGTDASKIAIHFGRLNQIVYTLYPLLKNNLRIKKTRISIFSDYNLPKSTYYGKLHLSVSIGRAVIFGFTSMGSLLRFYFKHKNTSESGEIINGQRQAQAG